VKKKIERKFCLHCGKGRATIPIFVAGHAFFVHASCSKKIDQERLALATNGQTLARGKVWT
jgi:hypothetical protein